MANITITIGSTVLPPPSKYNSVRLPQYAEFISLNGLVWRDRRSLEPAYVITLAWEALTPAEKGLVDAAWEAILTASAGTTVRFIGLTNSPYNVQTDERSNDYNYTGYMGAVQGTGFTTLYDATLIFRAERVFV
jgi:hypothetical protein